MTGEPAEKPKRRRHASKGQVARSSETRDATPAAADPSLAVTAVPPAASQDSLNVSPTPPDSEETRPTFPIVGIGASAGGLTALEGLLSHLPNEGKMGLAFVLVQHLDPDRKSILVDLLRQYTHMHVYEAEDGMTVQPNCAYIIPPNKDMTLVAGRLHLAAPSLPRGLRLPIDSFFRSLALDQGDRGMCIILSGTGTDGTLGLRAIKEAGGMAMVQRPESAQYDGMPRSAIATGLVDFVLPPEEMPAHLLAYVQRAYVTPQPEIVARRDKDPLHEIFVLLRAHTGHDFSLYKRNTIYRRIERRMAVHQVETLDAYVTYLQQDAAELTMLFRELLIGVTSFFRDPEAFVALSEQVIGPLLTSKLPGDAVRVWVPGCSTGEEAYSIAILLQETMSRLKTEFRVQVFGTDIDAIAIEQARIGIYPNSIAADVTPERLARFFTEENNAFRVRKVVRDMVVFAEQNIIDDPPFSRLDLMSCRNLLIYMSAELQRKVLPIAHYALRPGGYLFLGGSETIGEQNDLFGPVDRKWKIFMRRPGLLGQYGQVTFGRVQTVPDRAARPAKGEVRQEEKQDVRQLVEQALLVGHTPAAVLVNEGGDVMYVHGRTGQFLEPASGEASLNLVRMARDGLRLPLMAALRKATSGQVEVVSRNVSVRSNGSYHTVDLIIRPVTDVPGMQGLYLVIFQEHLEVNDDAAPPSDDETVSRERVALLERELRAKEEYLQTTIEELETSNEELKSANEELQSANEELQSTNEELETSKEELQSVNEELLTVHAELQKKLDELSSVNNDLTNLLASTGIGTIFVDHQLRIQRFTPAATEIINLIQSDIGRPVSDLVSNLVEYERLGQDVVQVLNTLRSHEEEVQTRKGQWFLMRIQPYRTIENVIEGAVITLVNITDYKHMQQSLAETQRHLTEMRQEEDGLRQDAERLRKLALFMRDAKEAVVIQDYNDEIISWNPAAQELYGWQENEAVGSKSDIIVPPTERERRRGMIERLRAGETVRPYTALRRTKGGQEITVLVTSYPLYSGEGEVYGFATTERPVAGE